MSSVMSSSNIESELYYLVAKYLESGPCHRSAQLLKKEIEENSLLPKRFDWLGRQHDSTFDEVNRQNGHISCDHLFKIVQRTNGLLDAVISPSVSGVSTLLGDGRQSLLRDKSNCISIVFIFVLIFNSFSIDFTFVLVFNCFYICFGFQLILIFNSYLATNRLCSSLHLSSFRNGSQMLPSAHSIASHPYNLGIDYVINCFEFCKILNLI